MSSLRSLLSLAFIIITAMPALCVDKPGLISAPPPFIFYNPATGLPANPYQVATLCQGQSVDHCIQVSSAGSNHDIISFSGNVGTVTIAPPTQPYDTCFRYVAQFNFVGYDTVAFTVQNNLGETDVLNLIFLVVNPNTPINGGPDQQLCNGLNSTTLSAINPDPYANGYWTKIGGTGTIVTPDAPTTLVTGMSLGTNIFVWNQAYPCQLKTDIVIVYVYSGVPPVANAGPDALLCSGNTYNMLANSPGTTATGTWEIIAGNATIFNINSATALVANIGIGVNVFVWNISNGPCPGGETSDEMIIYVYNQNHPPANAGPDQNYCSNNIPLVTLSGNAPQSPATGLWTQVAGPNTATINNPASATTTLANLIVGSYTFQWTISNGPCGTLTDQVVVNVYDANQPAANAGPNQGICLPDNSAVMAANAVIFPAVGTWSVIAGAASFGNINSPTTTVTNLATGTNILRWTINNGPCGTTQSDVTIDVFPAVQPTADAGPDQQFCFTGTPITANLSGSSFTAPATGTWSVLSGTGTFGNASSSNTTVTGLSIGQNVIQWSVTNGPCGGGGTDQMIITVFNNSIAQANAGPNAQLCTPASTYTMQAVPVASPAIGVWSQLSGPSVAVISNVNSHNAQISNLVPGVYTFQWAIDNGACGSGTNLATMTISVFNNSLPPANAGPDQEFCFAGAVPITATLAASTVSSPASGTWSFVSGSGLITEPSNPNTTVSGLFAGTYVLQWTVNNGPCGTTSDQMTIEVFNSAQTAANAGPDQQVCSTTPSVALSANPLLTPATGQWTVVSGTGVFSNPTSPNTNVTGLSIGNNVFQWTIDNGPCVLPTVLSDQVTVTVFNSLQQAANAGPDQSICNTTTSVVMAANTASFPASGQWSTIQGTGTFSNINSPVSSVTGLSIGENIFQWSINNGPCGPVTTDQVSIFVYLSTPAAASAGPDQFLCLPVTSTTLAGNAPVFPATGQWTVITGAPGITFSNSASPTSTISGLEVGETILQWTIDNGPCGIITSDQVSIFLFDNTQDAASAGPDASLCTPQSTYVMQANEVTFPAVGQWTLMSGTGTIGGVNNPNATISGLGVGANVFRWTILNGPCPGGSNFDEMVIYVFDQNQPTANAGPDQQLCFDGINPVNVVMAGSSVIFPGMGTWTTVQGGGTILNPNSPTTTITNLPVGENIFQWTVSNGPCNPPLTSDQVSIFVYSGLQLAANAGPDQDICSDNPSTTLAANSVIFPATGQWSVVQGTGVFADAANPGTMVSDLSLGVNIFQWSIHNGPCGPITTDQVVITVYDQFQFPADAGTDQSICSTQSSAQLNGNPVSAPATAQWTVIAGSGAFSNPNISNPTVTGLSIGTNTFQYTINNGACNSQTSDLMSIVVYSDQQTAAFAGLDQQICLPQESTTLTGNNLTGPATGLWTLTSGSGIIANPTSSTTLVTGLAVGMNVFTWTVSNGPCDPGITSDQVAIYVFDNTQPAANAGPDQSFCEPVSSATLSANSPIFPASGQWFLIQGTGIISSPTSPTTLVTGLGVGENIFMWVINNGPCDPTQTTDLVSIFIFDDSQLPANAGPDQTLCTPANSTTLQANSLIFPATGQWQLVSGTGIIVSPNSPSTVVLGLSPGTNTFSWTVNNGPCGPVTTDQVSVLVYTSGADVADAGSDQSICLPLNAVTLNGNLPVPPATGFWQLVSGSGIITDALSPGTTVSNLLVGENIFEWTIDNGGCGAGLTSDQVSIFVYSNVAANADAGPDQNLCTPQSATTMQANSAVFPGFGEWTLVSGTGLIADTNNPNTAITGLSVGANVFQWTIYNGPCPNGVTSDLVIINVFDSGFPAPYAGPDQELCSPTTSTTLSADPAINPGIGTWTVEQGTGLFSNINDPNAIVTGLSIGINIFRWNVDYSTCGQPFDEVSVIVYNSAQGAAQAGDDQSLCTPINFTTLDAQPVLSPGYGTWSLIQGSGIVADLNNPASEVFNLGVGENIFQWTVYNGDCLAPELTTDQVSIFVFSELQTAANAGPDQQLCTPLLSTVLSGNSLIFPASGQWELISGSGIIASPNTPFTAVSNLTVGENIFQWTVSNGTCNPSVTTDFVSVFVFDENLPAADAGPDQELCLPQTSTSMMASPLVFPATGLWQLIAGTGIIQDVNNPNTLVTGLSVGMNTFSWTVNNGACGPPTTDYVNIFVFDPANPVAAAGPDIEMCLPQNSVGMNASALIYPAQGMWSQIAGSPALIFTPNSPYTLISNLGVGENVFVWTVYNGPCPNSPTSDTLSIFVFNPAAPVANAGPDQQWCTPANSTNMEAATPTAPGTGTWTVVQGGAGVSIADVHDPNTLVSGFEVGQTILQWTVYNGPCAVTNTTDQVSIFLFDGAQPPADAGPDQQLCTPLTSAVMAANQPIFPATGFWNLVSGSGDIVNISDPATQVNNLAIGTNQLQWTINNGPCLPSITSDIMEVSVYDHTLPLANAGEDQELCLPQNSTALNGSPLNGVAQGNWALVSGGGIIISPSQPGTQVTDMPQGYNIFSWTVDNGACGTSGDEVQIAVFNADPQPADAGPDASFCTPVSTYTMQANTAIDPAVGTWSLIGGQGTISDIHHPSAEISGLVVGANVFVWNLYNGPCLPATTDTMVVFIFDENQQMANAGMDQELCLPQTGTSMNANVPVFPALGTWTLVQGSGTIVNANNPQTAIVNLAVGENIFEWTIDNGPCNNPVTSDTVSIFVYDDSANVADAGSDQEYCQPVNSAQLHAATPDAPGTGTWVLVGGTGIIAEPGNPESMVYNLSVGTNCFMWTVYNGPCTNTNTSDVVCIEIFDDDQPAANAGADQSFCTPNTTTNLAGNAVIAPAEGTWELIQGAAVIADPSDPNTLVTGLAPGVNLFTWSISNGPCEPPYTVDTVAVSIYIADLPAANAGPDQQLCFPQTTATLTGSMLEGAATGIWTLVQGAGDIANPNESVTEITNLEVGENIFMWTVFNGPCGTTSDMVSILVYDPAAPTADAGHDAYYCTPISSHTMDANPATEPGVGTWIFITGGGIIQEPNNPHTEITNLPVGENIFLWCIDNGPCGLSCDVVSIFIYNESTLPANAGADIEICLPQACATMSASPAEFPAIGQWTLIQGTGNISDVNSPTSTMCDLSLGENKFVWTVNNGPCIPSITSDTVSIFVFQNDIISLAGPDHEICTPANAVFMNANVPEVPNYGTWQLVSGSAAIVSPNDPFSEITDLAAGINCLAWNIYNGPCPNGLASDTLCVYVFDQNQPPADAGPDQEFCLPQNNTTLTGNVPAVPATGVWTQIQGNGNIVNPNSPQTEVTGLEQGVNLFVWTIDNGPCIDAITSDTVMVEVFPQNSQTAMAGPDIELCSPEDCPSLHALAPDLPSTGTWTILSAINGNGSIPFGTIDDITDPQATICALGVGLHTLQWELYNGPCNEPTSDIMTIAVYDSTGTDAHAGPDQELCWPQNSTTLAANTPIFPSQGTWIIISGAATISDIHNPSASVSNLQTGITELQWSVYEGPCGTTSDNVIITVFDPQSPDADAGPDQQLCADQPTVTMAGSVPIPPSYGQWTLISGEGSITNPSSPNTTISGVGYLENMFMWAVYNGACGNWSYDTVSVFVNSPTIGAADAGPDQDFCGPVDALVLNGSDVGSSAAGTWSIVQGGGTFSDIHQDEPTVTNIPVGINQYMWTVDNGVCGLSSDIVTINVFDDQLVPANAGASVAVCEHLFAPFGLSASGIVPPAVGTWSVLSGPVEILDPNDPNTLVVNAGHISTPLVDVISVLQWSVFNGPCGSSADTLMVVLQDCMTIKIPDAFSPNGDGINDTWYISNLNTFPNNRVQIFNRWGALLFEAAPYKNDWDGRSHHAATIGEELPVSTYYYILDLGTGEEAFSGFIYLKR